jgi:hypothetical protein
MTLAAEEAGQILSQDSRGRVLHRHKTANQTLAGAPALVTNRGDVVTIRIM